MRACGKTPVAFLVVASRPVWPFSAAHVPIGDRPWSGARKQLIRDSLYVTSALDFFRPAVSNRKTIASLIYTEGGMNLRDALRHAEQQGKKQVQRGAEKLHDVETSLRRKFERHAAASTTPYSDSDQESQTSSRDKGRTGIVSVHGRDVGEMRCTGGRRSA